MNQTANRLRHIHNEAAIASQSNPFEVMMNGLKEEFGCVSQRYDAIMDIALFYIADELDELQAKVDGLRKQVPSERERHILDMWPRFEDGEPVMFGDRFIDHRVNERTVRSVIVNDDGVELRTFDGTFDWHETGERVKRTVQRVLDADGVEIKVGDTVWFKGSPRPYAVVEVKDGSVRLHSKTHCSEESATTVCTDILTHIAPDSWEQLEEDAAKEPCDYFGVECDEDKGCSGCPHLHEGRDCAIDLQADLIRRAKALAGVEVGQ